MNNTGTKEVSIIKQTAFWREKNGEYRACLKCLVPTFVEQIYKMQRLEVSGVVRLIYRSLGVKGLTWSSFYQMTIWLVAALPPSVKLYVPLPTVVVVVEFGGSPAPIQHTLQQHSVGGTEGKHENPQSPILNSWHNIWTCDLPNTGSLFYITTIGFHFLAVCFIILT